MSNARDFRFSCFHGFGDVIERVREFFRVWPVTVSEAGIIGRDKVIVIGKLGEERLEHPRGRRESVQQEKRRRVFRTGFSVKDGEPLDLYVAIKGWVFHGPLLSLGLRSQVKWSERHRNQKCHAEDLQESEPTGRVERVHSLPPR